MAAKASARAGAKCSGSRATAGSGLAYASSSLATSRCRRVKSRHASLVSLERDLSASRNASAARAAAWEKLAPGRSATPGRDAPRLVPPRGALAAVVRCATAHPDIVQSATGIRSSLSSERASASAALRSAPL
eukprot:scaffold6711_cov118-Isochrysis_galbana.AAC.8